MSFTGDEAIVYLGNTQVGMNLQRILGRIRYVVYDWLRYKLLIITFSRRYSVPSAFQANVLSHYNRLYIKDRNFHTFNSFKEIKYPGIYILVDNHLECKGGIEYIIKKLRDIL